MTNKKLRLAIVMSHPIQHFCPQYVSLTKNTDIELKVFFASALGFKSYIDVNFKKEISWSNLNLDKFNHHFLNGDAVIQADKNLDAVTLGYELEKYQPDLIFTYGYFQKLQRRTSRWAIKNKVKLAYISDSELRHKRNSIKEFLKSIFLRRYFSKMNYFLTMGNANEAYYQKNGVPAAKMIRMHYPIDFETYKNSFDKKEILRKKIRDKYGISKDEIVISVVGKLVSWKNQDHIIDAMKLLEEDGVVINLFMLGSGEMKDVWDQKSNKLKKSKVHFTGFVNIEELPAYYSATDIYVHPASLEPHSVAVSEAIMMGCPIILSNRCGSYGDTDDVQEGRNGYVYEFGNIKSLAEKIKMLSKDKTKRESFGKYSHELGMQFQQNSHCVFLEKLISRYMSDTNQ